MKIPFVAIIQDAVVNVLKQFGIQGIKRAQAEKLEAMIIEQDITAFVGIVGDVRGNLSFCFSKATGQNLAAKMMSEDSVEAMDEISRSALAELANMFTGNAVSAFSDHGLNLQTTAPSVVDGEDMYFILSFFQTVKIVLDTEVGQVHIHIGLEI